MSNQQTPHHELWMIRKSNNHLIGPVATQQVLEMVEQGMLEPDDELCPENSYWFTLAEVDEVKKNLGINEVFVRRKKGADGEETLSEDTLSGPEDDTLTGDLNLAESQVTDTESTGMIRLPARVPKPALTQSKVAELQAQPALSGDELAKRFSRPASAIIGFQQPGESNDQDGQNNRVVERSKVWGLFVLVGILILAWGVLKVINLLSVTE